MIKTSYETYLKRNTEEKWKELNPELNIVFSYKYFSEDKKSYVWYNKTIRV